MMEKSKDGYWCSYVEVELWWYDFLNVFGIFWERWDILVKRIGAELK